MRISDWSSDVCSSDLHRPLADGARRSCPADVLRDRHPPLVAERRLEAPKAREQRSDEHTSELQSLMRISYAVFCLKKKRHKNDNKLTQRQYIQAQKS